VSITAVPLPIWNCRKWAFLGVSETLALLDLRGHTSANFPQLYMSAFRPVENESPSQHHRPPQEPVGMRQMRRCFDRMANFSLLFSPNLIPNRQRLPRQKYLH